MKKCITILFVCMSLQLYGQVDPTGTYYMDNTKTDSSTGEVYGYSGSIDVIRYKDEWIIMCFFVCKGAPSYNMGEFYDTIPYKTNTALYTTAFDTSCRITFLFSQKGVKVTEETANFNCGCAFGHAVIADGFYIKSTCCRPEVRMAGTGERLENRTSYNLLKYIAIFNCCYFLELARKKGSIPFHPPQKILQSLEPRHAPVPFSNVQRSVFFNDQLPPEYPG